MATDSTSIRSRWKCIRISLSCYCVAHETNNIKTKVCKGTHRHTSRCPYCLVLCKLREIRSRDEEPWKHPQRKLWKLVVWRIKAYQTPRRQSCPTWPDSKRFLYLPLSTTYTRAPFIFGATSETAVRLTSEAARNYRQGSERTQAEWSGGFIRESEWT